MKTLTRLVGTVTIGTSPASDAVVELHNSDGDIVDQVHVDEAGRFVYHLIPGAWSVRVWDPFGHRGVREVTLVEGQEAALQLELEETER